MPILDGPPSTYSRSDYVDDVFMHADGMLRVTSGANITYSFIWHEYLADGLPWPFLEIRKRLFDRDGQAHSATSFVSGCKVFGGVNGRTVYSEKAFLDSFEKYDVKPLTSFADFYCDSREMLMFQFHDESGTAQPQFVAHFEKYTGGEMRLVAADIWIFLEVRMTYFDDRISNEHIKLDRPVFFDITLDKWRNVYHARTAEEFKSWYSSNLIEPTFLTPLIFAKSDEAGTPDPKVEHIEEPWSDERSRELINEEIQRLEASD